MCRIVNSMIINIQNFIINFLNTYTKNIRYISIFKPTKNVKKKIIVILSGMRHANRPTHTA